LEEGFTDEGDREREQYGFGRRRWFGVGGEDGGLDVAVRIMFTWLIVAMLIYV